VPEFPSWPSGVYGVDLLDGVDDRGTPQVVPAERRARRHEGPVRASVSVAATPLARAVRAIEAAGVQPPAEVTDGLARCRDLLAEAKRASADPAETVVGRLASGDLSAGDLRPADREAERRQALDRHGLLQAAADQAYSEAAAHLATVGDDLLAGQLRTIVRDCLDVPDQDDAEDRWTAAWEAVKALRHGRFAASAKGIPPAGALYARPDLAATWQLDAVAGRHRDAVEVVAAVDGRYQGRRVRVVQRKPRRLPNVSTDLPDVTTLDVAVAHRADWHPDLWTAHEAAAHWSAILAAHDAIIDAADEPAPRPTSRAVFI
jgi:hypothetical protein